MYYTDQEMFKKLKYKFDTALERNFVNLVFLLFLFSISGILFFAVIYTVLQAFDLTAKDIGFFEFFWRSFTYFLDVGTLSAESYQDNNFAEILLKIGITFFGIIIFSTLVGIITSTLSLRIEELRSGKSPIDEEQHIIICNFTKKTIPVIQELINANAKKKIVIAILSNLKPSEAQLRISNQIKKLPNVKIICRKGFMWQPNMIEIMNIERCEQIIILNPDVDHENYNTELDADIEVLKDFSAIVQSNAWKKKSCNIVAEYFNEEVGEQAKDFNQNVIKEQLIKIKNISSSDIKEQLIAQCINTPELIQIFENLFGFKGSEIYLIDESKINNFRKVYNKTIKELNLIFNKIIIIGCFYDDNKKTDPNIIFNPNQNYKIKKNYGLICIAENENEIKKDFQELENYEIPSIKEVDLKITEERHNKNILIINTSNTEEKAIQINNTILEHNYLKNIQQIKVLNKTDNVEDKNKYSNKLSRNITNELYGVEFQLIEILCQNKSKFALQVTNKSDFSLNTFKDIFEIGDYLWGWEPSIIENSNISWDQFLNIKKSTLTTPTSSVSCLKLLRYDLLANNESMGFYISKEIKGDLGIHNLSQAQCGDLSRFHKELLSSKDKTIKHDFAKLNVDQTESSFKDFFEKEKINEFSNIIVINNEIEGQNKINPVDDHDMISYYIGVSNGYKKYPKLFNLEEKLKWSETESDWLLTEYSYQYDNDINDPSKKFNHLDTEKSPSYITEVNSFRTKKILDNYKKNIYQTFFGTDIIDSNSLIGKIIASTFYQPATKKIIDKLITENHFIKSYTIKDKDISITFRELEIYFQKFNQILLGYVDYDYEHFVEGGLRKLKKIVINPDQKQKINLNCGDRLITLSHY